MGRDCASERVAIALAEGRPEDSRTKASAEIEVAAVTVEGSPQTGTERPRSPELRRARALHLQQPQDHGAVVLAGATHSAEPVDQTSSSQVSFWPRLSSWAS